MKRRISNPIRCLSVLALAALSAACGDRDGRYVGTKTISDGINPPVQSQVELVVTEDDDRLTVSINSPNDGQSGDVQATKIGDQSFGIDSGQLSQGTNFNQESAGTNTFLLGGPLSGGTITFSNDQNQLTISSKVMSNQNTELLLQ